jgi:hypothetical protein
MIDRLTLFIVEHGDIIITIGLGVCLGNIFQIWVQEKFNKK